VRETPREKITRDMVSYVLLSGGLIVILLPLLWMVSTALKDMQQVFRFPPTLIPDPFYWTNFRDAFTMDTLPFAQFFINSTIITVAATIGSVISSVIVAYSFARIEWKGRDLLFFVVITTMMIPHEITLVPRFILFRDLGWLDTYLPLIVPEYFGRPFFIFLLRQYMLTIPREIDQAAIIDGCNEWQLLVRIIVPVTTLAMFSVIVFSIQTHWNEFLEPLVFVNRLERFPISVGLAMFNGQYGTRYNLLMAASLVSMLPLVLIFAFFQKYFIEGVVVTGVKQ
jgi:multiple sugar transport system permease protein